MSLTNRTFAILGVCGIDFVSLVHKGWSKSSSESVRYAIKKITRNGLESFFNQRSLGNAMKIWSAVENVLTLTYLNNKHFHMQRAGVSSYSNTTWATHNQRQKQTNSNIIRSWVGVYSVSEVPVESSAGSSSLMDHIPCRWYASRTPRAGWVMSSVKYDVKIELHTELKC